MFNKDENIDSGAMTGFIGKGMKVEGTMNFEGTARIDGNLKGDIFSTGTLFVGEGALIEGTIKVGNIIVSGEVQGTIKTSGKTELKEPGKVFGDINTPTLIIGEGVIFEGNCIMEKKGPVIKESGSQTKKEPETVNT